MSNTAYFFNAFSAICLGKSKSVFSRQQMPIFNKSLKVSCSLISSFFAQSFISSTVLSASLTGIVFLNFSFINSKVYTKFILDNL